jgi:hypothetical protein
VSPGHFSECIKYDELEKTPDIWNTLQNGVLSS